MALEIASLAFVFFALGFLAAKLHTLLRLPNSDRDEQHGKYDDPGDERSIGGHGGEK